MLYIRLVTKTVSIIMFYFFGSQSSPLWKWLEPGFMAIGCKIQSHFGQNADYLSIINFYSAGTATEYIIREAFLFIDYFVVFFGIRLFWDIDIILNIWKSNWIEFENSLWGRIVQRAGEKQFTDLQWITIIQITLTWAWNAWNKRRTLKLQNQTNMDLDPWESES